MLERMCRVLIKHAGKDLPACIAEWGSDSPQHPDLSRKLKELARPDVHEFVCLCLGGNQDVTFIPRRSRRKPFAPPDLLEARQAHVSLQELEALEDRHISRVLQSSRNSG